MESSIAIDDILKKIDPQLVANYERNVLPQGSSLIKMSKIYKDTDTEKSRKITFRSILFVVILGALMLFFSGITNNNGQIIPTFAYAGITLIVISFPFAFFCEWKINKKQRKIDDLYEVLMAFRDSVIKLNPSGDISLEYSEDTVRKESVFIAFSKICAENGFDKACSGGLNNKENIMSLGYQIDSRGREFDSLLVEAKKFGLAFNRRDIFKEAQKDFERHA